MRIRVKFASHTLRTGEVTNRLQWDWDSITRYNLYQELKREITHTEGNQNSTTIRLYGRLQTHSNGMRFDYAVQSLSRGQERDHPYRNKSGCHRGTPGLLAGYHSIGDKCLKINPMALKRFRQLYGIRTHISDHVHTTMVLWFYGKGLPAHIVTIGYVLQ